MGSHPYWSACTSAKRGASAGSLSLLSSQLLTLYRTHGVLCPLTLLPYHVRFTQLHDEELNDDEEDENEEGHQREQQDATVPPGQS